MAAETSRRDLLRSIAAGSLTTALASAPSRAQIHVNRKLLLGGGGITGAYQAGVLKVLLEQGVVTNVINGVSVGGLNAAFLVDRAYFLG